MIVTDKKYSMDKALLEKLDLICDRFDKKLDALLIIDGDEGYGKSTISCAIAYYIAYKTGRTFNVDNVFFKPEELLQYGTTHEEEIILWDEAVLAGLAANWRSGVQQKLIQLLMMARKKKHLFIFNIPKFFKLNEYIAIDRSIALVHVYARKEKELGKFTYYTKRRKEELFNDWRRKKKRNYKGIKHLRGSFPDVLSRIIDEEAYEKKKDAAILSILDDEKMTKDKLQRNIAIKIIRETSNLKLIEIRELFNKYGCDIGKSTLGDILKKEYEIIPVTRN